MSQSSPEGIVLGKGSTLVKMELSVSEKQQTDILEVGQIAAKEEPKQETLEEVAENELRKQNWDTTITLPFNGGFIEGFQQGAKWQQEQDKNKYSEEEVLEILDKRLLSVALVPNRKSTVHWFRQYTKKQFKKK